MITKFEAYGQEQETEFNPCPRCGSIRVKWTNSRDLNVLTSEVFCIDCGLSTFNVETIALGENLPNLDYETTLMKYNAWTDSNPNSYRDENW